MKQFEIDQLEDACTKIQSEINETINITNQAITNSYNTIISTANKISQVKDKVSVLGDMLTDLKVINNSTGTLIDIDALDIISSKGIVIEDDTIELQKTKEIIVEFDYKSSSIFSTKPLQLLDNKGKEKSIEDVFKYKDITKFTVESLNITINYNLIYSKISKINQIVIELPLDTEVYPTLSGLKYLSTKSSNSYLPIKFQNTSSTIIDMNESRKIGNVYIFDIEPIDTKEIIFEINSKDFRYINISKIETKYVERVLEGSIVLGPIVTDEPILKASISSEKSTDNVKIELSHDQFVWFEMVDTGRINLENNRKILAYNTVNNSSIKTVEDVYNIYLRLTLSSETIDNDIVYPFEDFREDGSITTDLKLLDPTRVSAFRINNDDFYYGSYSYSNSSNITNNMKIDIEKLSISGSLLVRGFDETIYSYGIKPTITNSVEVKLRHKRLNASTGIDASSFDSVSSKLFDMLTIPINGEININSEKSIVFKLKEKEDTYRLVANESKRHISYDINSNFLNSSFNALIQVPYEDINLLDSLGNLIKTLKKENHLHIKNNEENFYFVNLSESLYTITDVRDYIFNPLYPLVALNQNEFSLEDNQIVLGSKNIVEIKGFKINKIEINKTLLVSYQNGNTWERIDPLYTYHHTQVDRDNIEKTVIKLNNRSIEKGTLKIYEYSDFKEEDKKLVLLATSKDNENKTEYLTEETNSNIFIRG